MSKSRIKSKNAKKRGMGIYMKNIITRKVYIPFNAIGQNIKQNIYDSKLPIFLFIF